MTNVTVQTIVDPCCQVENPATLMGIPLAKIKHVATATGWPADYSGLVDAGCGAARSFSDALFAKGYRPWLLLVGGALGERTMPRPPNYSLVRPAREKNMVGEIAIERIFHLEKAERTLGLYSMAPERLRDGCEYLTHHSWAHIILSRRGDFLSGMTLDLIYQSGGADSGRISSPINWLTLSIALCPFGDVVVTTDGAFDDRWRAVTFVYAADNPMIGAVPQGRASPIPK
jgi:hypothetical protein